MVAESRTGLVPIWSSSPSLSIHMFPRDGVEILHQSLEAQGEVERTFRERETGQMACLNFKRSLNHLLRVQNERRAQLQAAEQSAAEYTQTLLSKLVVVMREMQKAMNPDGYQCVTFENGDVYEGNWKSCRMHGTGVMRRAQDHDVYEGEWFFGVRNGTGMCYSREFSTIYSGKWLAGKWHGRGELVEVEGLYVGDFVHGQIQGYGEYLYREGFAYKGDWVNGVYDGSGTLFYPNGAKYEGQWRKGHEHGRGTMTYYNGDVYTGEWYNGRKHGTGTYTGKLLLYEGKWSNGAANGYGKCTYTDGSTYAGWWSKGLYDGCGEFVSKDKKSRYEGDFRAGKRCGQGVYQGEEVEYSGGWLDDKRHGMGEIKMQDGSFFRGMWVNDVPVCDQSPGGNLGGVPVPSCGGGASSFTSGKDGAVLDMRLVLSGDVLS